MTVKFDGDVIVVTGAGGGIGREYAHLAASRGARVVVNDYGGDLNGTPGGSERAEAVAEQIRRAGGKAIADATDVATTDAGDRIIGLALRTWGRVDGVVNNAGATRGAMSIEANSDEDFLHTFQIHTMGSVRLARAAWPHMKRARHGRIVNTSSDSLWGMAASTYVTAKAANFGLTRALAAEGAPHNILVNTVSPCGVTRMSPLFATGVQERVDRYLFAAGAAPLVVSLLRRENTVNGTMFQAGGNRAAEMFLAVTRGYAAGPDNPLDELIDHFDETLDRSEWDSPRDAEESVGLILNRLQGSEECSNATMTIFDRDALDRASVLPPGERRR